MQTVAFGSRPYTASLMNLLSPRITSSQFSSTSREIYHGDRDSSRGILGCDAVWWCGRVTTFRKTIVPPYSGCIWKQYGPPIIPVRRESFPV